MVTAADLPSSTEISTVEFYAFKIFIFQFVSLEKQNQVTEEVYNNKTRYTGKKANKRKTNSNKTRYTGSLKMPPL